MAEKYLRRFALPVLAALAAGLAFAGVGHGAPVRALACGGTVTLGAINSCDGSTRLTGSFDGNLLSATNTSTGGAAAAITGNANSAQAALRGVNTGTGSGVRGTANNGTGVTGTSTDGVGVYGTHSAATGPAAGVRGDTASTAANALGMFGRVTSTSPGAGSAAVRGQNLGTNGNGFGVYGSHAGSGTGVRGTSVGGTGVVGSDDSASGTGPGVEGDTSSTAGSAAGVLGKVVSTSPGGFSAGVRGINNGTGGLGIGVYGSHAGAGWGVYGDSPGGIGVRGESDDGVGVDASNNSATAPALQATNLGGGPAAAFSTSGAPFTLDSSTKVDNLNADQLDGLSANEFARTAVAAVISYNNHTAGTFEEATRIVIDAPRDGLMLVSGAVSFDTFVGGDTSCNPCIGVMRLRDVVTDATGTEQVASFGDGSHEEGAQVATSWVFVVEAGRRTFALDTVGAVPDAVFADNPTLTALFVPFGPSGVAAAGAVTKTAGAARQR